MMGRFMKVSPSKLGDMKLKSNLTSQSSTMPEPPFDYAAAALWLDALTRRRSWRSPSPSLRRVAGGIMLIYRKVAMHFGDKPPLASESLSNESLV